MDEQKNEGLQERTILSHCAFDHCAFIGKFQSVSFVNIPLKAPKAFILFLTIFVASLFHFS